MLKNASKEEKKNARKWLVHISKPAKFWINMTIGISFVNGLLLILQLYLLSHISYTAYIEKYSLEMLSTYFIVIVVIVIIRSFLNGIKEVVSFKTAYSVKETLRKDIIMHINRLGPVRSSKLTSGELISASMEQVEAITNFLTHFLPQMTLAGLMPFAILFFVFPQSIVCGILLLICAPLIPLFMIVIGVSAESEHQKNFKSLARMSSIFLDTIKGLSTLKLFNQNKHQATVIRECSDNFRIKTMKVLKIAFLSSAVLELFSATSIALVAIYLGMGFINAGTGNDTWWALTNITIQGGLFILLLAPEVFLPLRELSTHYHAKAEAVGAWLEIAKIFEMNINNHNVQIYKKVSLDKIYKIKFDNVSVRYETKTKNAISNININVNAKDKIAIVGASGAGKSTFINTILKFVNVNKGEIIINDKYNLNNIVDKQWLKHITWLGQNASVIKGSIRDNLLIANAKASDDELWQVLDRAKFKKHISSLHQGLDTQIGEGGVGLSGGQVQRLALARAYLKKADILLLDEPTASLDKKIEEHIITSLADHWQDQTVIMLSHRLDFLSKMDKIVVFDQGEIVQSGSFADLIVDKNGFFARNIIKNVP